MRKKLQKNQFHKRVDDLDEIKHQALDFLHRCNTLHYDYTDWYRRKQLSFMRAIRTVTMASGCLVDENLLNMTSFMVAAEMSVYVTNTNDCRELNKFLTFWRRLVELKNDLKNELYKDIVKYVSEITRLRQPNIMDQIVESHERLTLMCTMDFEFLEIPTSEFDQFTYSVMIGDKHNHCLVAFIPILLQICSNICFLIGKLFLEKE